MRIDHQYYTMGVKALLVSSGVVLFNFHQHTLHLGFFVDLVSFGV